MMRGFLGGALSMNVPSSTRGYFLNFHTLYTGIYTILLPGHIVRTNRLQEPGFRLSVIGSVKHETLMFTISEQYDITCSKYCALPLFSPQLNRID